MTGVAMSDPPTEAVLDMIREQLGDDGLWTSRRYLRAECNKDHVDVTPREVDQSLAHLRADVEIVTWHGLVSLVDDDTIQRLLEAEGDADYPREMLISRLNRIRAGEYDPDPVVPFATGEKKSLDVDAMEADDGGA